jgi:hypothetical protein
MAALVIVGQERQSVSAASMAFLVVGKDTVDIGKVNKTKKGFKDNSIRGDAHSKLGSPDGCHTLFVEECGCEVSIHRKLYD